MPEAVGTFLSSDARQETANGSAQTRNCPFGSLAQELLDRAKHHLDGIEFGRVRGQVAKSRPCALDRLTNACSFMNIDVVHHDGIAAPERGGEALFDIGQEHLSRHGAFEHHRSDDLVVTQAGHEGDRLPLSKWGAPDQFDASRTPSPKPHHVGSDCSLVDEYQSGGIKHALLPDPAPPRPGDVRALLFGGPQTLFFLKVMSCRSRNRWTALLLVRIRRLSSSPTISFKVRSGRAVIKANISSE